mmetsp:Transcript_31599/g.64574  ORF Transcript_31599/g.64574 Transcript_31599/m.64574 type:complete len:87 (-) Transcript_31599:436-696(-)
MCSQVQSMLRKMVSFMEDIGDVYRVKKLKTSTLKPVIGLQLSTASPKASKEWNLVRVVEIINGPEGLILLLFIQFIILFILGSEEQ